MSTASAITATITPIGNDFAIRPLPSDRCPLERLYHRAVQGAAR
jgi:hypothetical protein